MSYTPPSGWIDPGTAQEDKPRRAFFHVRDDCVRVPAGAVLRRSWKPFSANRCTACARP